VALGIDLASKPFVKSTLQLFRAQLHIHGEAAAMFEASLEEAKRCGFLRGNKRTLALDTTPIFGKGAVKDSYNLVGTGIVMLVRALAAVVDEEPAAWAAAHDLSRYFGTSLKGEAAINWDDRDARGTLLASIVGDAQRLLQLTRTTRGALPAGHPAQEALEQAAALLCQLLVQDIEPDAQGAPQLREGVAEDRMPSAGDPEMRHGRKSKSSRFDGHKATIAVDTEDGLITAVEVIAGNAPDAANALDLVAQSEASTGWAVDKVIGDCAYGDGATRQAFAESERTLVAKVPARPAGQLSKDEFDIDLDHDCVTCPGGHTVRGSRPLKRNGQLARMFCFPAAVLR
jgi:Transposase DDE domain